MMLFQYDLWIIVLRIIPDTPQYVIDGSSSNSTVFFPLNQPTEYNTYADIDAAYKCLKEQYGVKDEQLILYGQSVGSGPTVDLASRLPTLRGVVLHSPILSGLRVLYPVKRTYWFDIYKVCYLNTVVMLTSFVYYPYNHFFSLFRISTK